MGLDSLRLEAEISRLSCRCVRTARFFRKRIVADREGPRPRSSANFVELAAAAFSFELRTIAQCTEQWSVLIDFRQRLLANIAC